MAGMNRYAGVVTFQAQHLLSTRCCHLLANYIVHFSVALQNEPAGLMQSTAQFSDV